MTNALIDSASLYQLVEHLDRGKANQYPWALKEATFITALMIRERNLAVAPGLQPPGGVAVDPYAQMLDQMVATAILRFDQPVLDAQKEEAVRTSNLWIRSPASIRKIKKEVERLHGDKENFQHWIDWAARNAWESHSLRLGALFDAQYEGTIARIIGLSQGDTADLRQLSQKRTQLQRLIRTRGADFDLMSKAYLASAILRGRYHEELARVAGRQLKRHPFRSVVAELETGPAAYSVGAGRAVTCLSHIVLYGAICQPTMAQRIDCFVANLRKVRGLLDRGGLALTDGTDVAVVEAAILVARQAGVEIASNRYGHYVDYAVGQLTNYLGSILLSPWISGPVSGAAEQYLKGKGRIPSAVREISYFALDQRLRDIASGRIHSTWSER